MADHSGIEWTEATWNPIVGCTHVSAGCDHCYAAREASGRLSKTPAYAGLASGGRFTGEVRLLPDRLTQPLRWRRPRRVFVNSMSDLFHQSIPDEFIARVFAVMAAAPQHTFQVLTKRHARMRALLGSPSFLPHVGASAATMSGGSVLMPPWPLHNVWLGVSVETQQWADIRVPALLDTPAAVHWLSCEPLLGPVEIARWLPSAEFPPCGYEHGDDPRVSECWQCISPQWVVVGGESGSGARPMHPEWARSLRDQCAGAGVPFLFKQWGEYSPEGPDERLVIVANDGTVYQRGDLSYPDGPRYGEAIRAKHDKAHLTAMYRVGKRAAGRELDGRTWDQYPEVARG